MNKMKVPDGWKIKNYGDLLSLQYGKSPKDIKDDDGKFPIIGTGGYVGFGNDYVFDGESIVIGRKGTIDNPTFVKGKFWAIDTTYFTSKYKNLVPKWFYYIVTNEGLGKYNEATGVPSLNRDTFNSIKTFVPPFPEQKKIASILTSVDEVIEKTQFKINKLQDLKKGTMNELLTKGIGHTEFKDSPIGKIPKNWEIKKLSDISTNYDSKRVPVKSSDRQNMKGIYRYYGASGVIDYVDDYIFDGKYILLGEDGENVVSRNLPLAFIVSGKFWVNNHAHILQPNQGVDIKFLCEYLESLDYTNIASGSAQPKITKSSLQKIKIKLPSYEEQQKIASILSSIDKTIEEKQRKLEQTINLKKSLMQDLLTGKVRVKNDFKR